MEYIGDVMRSLSKSKDIEDYINLFVVDNHIKLGREYSQKELLWYCSKIYDETLQKRWFRLIKKYFGKEFIKDFDTLKYRS